MKSISEIKFCEEKIGQSLKIKIPDTVDRARSDLWSILEVIMLGIISNKMYTINMCN